MRLALISSTIENAVFHPAESSLAVASFQYHFACAGFEDIAYFPPDGEAPVADIHKQFRRFAEETDCEIYAFSCWSNSFAFVKDFVAIIRETRPQAIIIGGGVHFQSKEDVRKNLENGLFDIIFSGGGDPFIELAISYFVKKSLKISRLKGALTLTGDVPKRGINYISRNGFIETPYGRMTRPILPVIFASDEKFEVQVLFTDKCDNACDYCSVYKNDAPPETRAETERLLLEQLSFVREQYNGMISISIMDSSPLQQANRAKTIASLRKVKSAFTDVCFTIFADPEDLDAELAGYVKELDIRTIFLGRDRVTEDAFIGRRLHGKLRGKERLDAEFETLREFMAMISGSAVKRELFVGYIVSPYEDAESAIKMLGETKYYAEQADSSLFVQSNVFILNPYKSTKLWKKLEQPPQDIADVYFPYPNVWGKNAYLEYIRLLIAPILSTGTFPKLGYNLFRLVYEKCFGLNTPAALPLSGDEMLLYELIAAKLETIDPLTDTVALYTLGAAPSVSQKMTNTLSKNIFEQMLKFIEQNDPLVGYLKIDIQKTGITL